MPILYYVPIIHSIKDWGLERSTFEKDYVRKLGKTKFDQFQKIIDVYWEIIEKRIDEKITEMKGLIIYQEGTPAYKRKKRVLKVFKYNYQCCPESPNYRLIKKLIDQGAMLVGIEDRNLINEHQQLYLREAEAESLEEQENASNAIMLRTQELTNLRDEFIAKRIYDTLPESGKGILFIGEKHDVITELEKLSRKFTIVNL